MALLPLLLLPALVAHLPEPPRAALVELRPGLFVLNGAPTARIFDEIKHRHITHVIDFRADAELDAEGAQENVRIQEMGCTYLRYALSAAPPAQDFTFVRGLLSGLPPGAKVLLHCATGNRAAAVLCPWLVLDRGLDPAEALKACRQAGMTATETDAAVKHYLITQAKL